MLDSSIWRAGFLRRSGTSKSLRLMHAEDSRIPTARATQTATPEVLRAERPPIVIVQCQGGYVGDHLKPNILIVDGYSTGTDLARALVQKGAHCLHIRSARMIPPVLAPSFDASLYSEDLGFLGDDVALVTRVAASREVCVVYWFICCYQRRRECLAQTIWSGWDINCPDVCSLYRDNRVVQRCECQKAHAHIPVSFRRMANLR